MKRIILAMIALCAVGAASPAFAQQTAGNISGRVLDTQGAAVPGVTVTARSPETGFVRADVSDSEGVYRLNSLPVGPYDLSAELSGFQTYARKGITVNVAQTTDLNVELKLAGVSESVNVTAEAPMLRTSDSSVGGVIDVTKIESLPLNGRQFANLAMAIPGVGIGFHSDPTKSTQYSPQIAGGNGRNVNYQIDGGDNNDDTVGGLLQLFPLEAIQEFNFITQRYKAEYGRSNGGVMNIVTKSGTNEPNGSWFTSLPRQEPERADRNREADQRRQAGRTAAISTAVRSAGRSCRTSAHFFAAFERTQQDTKQAVTTLGLFPARTASSRRQPREPVHRQGVGQRDAARSSCRCATAATPTRRCMAPAPRAVAENWGDSANKFNSINLNHNWVLGGSQAERVHLPVRRLRATTIAARTGAPQQTFPNGVIDRLQHQHAADDRAAQVSSSATTSRGT